MQYSILTRFGVYLNDSVPAKTLLYFYASLKKDEREDEQRRKAQQGNVRGQKRRM